MLVLILDKDGIVRLINDIGIRILGYPKKQIIGKDWFENFIPPDDREKVRTVFRHIISKNIQSNEYYENYILNGKGKKKLIGFRSRVLKNSQGSIVAVLSSGEDITEKRAEEQLLREQSELLSLAHDAIMMHDLNNNVLYWNKGAERLYGWRKSEIYGKTIYKVLLTVFPISREQIIKTILVKGHWEGILTHIKKNGDRVIVDSRWALYRDEEGNPKAIMEINRDITKQIELQHKKDEFISVASHELKTPLTSMKAYTQLLERLFIQKNDPLALSYLQKLNNQMDKMTKLVLELLDTSRIQSGKLVLHKSDFDLNGLVHEVITEIKEITNSHTLRNKTSGQLPVNADRERISQVIINLINNAIKYSPDTLEIDVRTEKKNDEVWFCVKDYGIGIPEHEQHKIFDRFYQIGVTRNKSDLSLGLGLYISSEIIKQHGGSMWVKSSPGIGSMFYFSLPLRQENN